MKVWVIVPTYDEAENLARLVPALRTHLSQWRAQILIVDDASGDGTGPILESFHREYGNVAILERPGKLGLGTALRAGLARALADPECEAICTLDADLSHDPAYLPLLLEAAERAAFVQGSRYVIGGRILNWPWHRRMLSQIANRLCRLLGSGLHEHTTNYRVYRRQAAEKALEVTSAGGFEWLVSVSLAIQAAGLPTVEVPIAFRERQVGKSKLTLSVGVRYGLFILRALMGRLAAGGGSVLRRAPAPVPAARQR